MTATDQQSIVRAVKRAGVVGAGGGGFPTHVKLSARVDIVIANGSECEPLLATDKMLMKDMPDLVIDGVKLAMTATGAAKGVIAVKGHYKDVVQSLERALPKDDSIKLFLMENYYPAGDEFLLVCDITGRVIPEGGIPLDVGVVVSNVVTLSQVARAVHGVPVTSRAVTVTGEVNCPGIVNVPIGAPYSELVKAAGGFKIRNAVLIDGGPMMGKIVDDLSSGIAKTTSGVIALPPDHLIVRMKSRSITQEMKLSRAACCQCFRCTDLCPRNLLGHELYPHMTMRTVNYQMKDSSQHVTSAFLCSQCGMCEMIACDIMRLSPRRVYADLRKRLSAAGVKNPHRRRGFEVREFYPLRKIPIQQMLRKLDVISYDRKLAFKGECCVSKVRIPLARHTGVPAFATVKKGDAVRVGDVVGDVPEDKLGARCHASIAGKVSAVTSEYVEISS